MKNLPTIDSILIKALIKASKRANVSATDLIVNSQKTDLTLQWSAEINRGLVLKQSSVTRLSLP